MMLRVTFILSMFAVLFIGIAPSIAKEALKLEEASDPAMDLLAAQNKALNKKVSTILQSLSKEEATHFLVMYTNYNLYSLVKAVSKDVGNAVDGCIENNPEMKDEINKRFSKWLDSVGESMKSTNVNIQNLSLAQTYAPQSEIKLIFGLVDEVRAVNSSRFEKTPVTTPEACQFMLSKMDETQDQMNSILKSTLSSYPNLMKKLQK